MVILKNRPKLELLLLLITTVVVHQVLFAMGLASSNHPMNDVTTVYKGWLDEAAASGAKFGIDTDWIYPFVAWLPIQLAESFSSDYTHGWLNLAMLLNLFALARLVSWGRSKDASRFRAAWFALAFTAFLGPVAISRLDGISTAIALCAVPAFLAGKDVAASIWLSIATWIKVWPIAAIGALLAVTDNLKRVMFWLVGVSAVIVLIALGQGGDKLFSFAAGQTNRGLQIEAPLALPWVWSSVNPASGSKIYFDETYVTFQVSGGGVDIVARLANLAMLVALAITAWLIWRARKSGTDRIELMAAGTLTGILDLIVFNKVGSPQYMAWMILPLALALAANLPKYRLPVRISLVGALFTQWIYPGVYDQLIASELSAIVLLTVRNLLLVYLLVWANRRLASLALK